MKDLMNRLETLQQLVDVAEGDWSPNDWNALGRWEMASGLAKAARGAIRLSRPDHARDFINLGIDAINGM